MSTLPEQPEEPCPLGPGDVLSQRYSLELLVGEGTFGWVFSAVDLSHALRRVAIKVLRPRFAAEEGMLRRLEERELALLLRVQELQPTPHVVHPLEPRVQRHEELWYLVLEFIDGPSLREVLDRGPSTDPEQVRRLGVGLAQGLAAIHAAGGVHRDLKPTNIRMRGGDTPVIVDFGTALTLWTSRDLTATGRAAMTPRYASPEQLAGRESTPASDVYSWGVILFEVLTGALPPSTGERTPPEQASWLPWREGRQALMDPVLRCLEYAPERRPTALELVELLSVSPVPRVHQREPRRVIGLLAALLLVLGGNDTVRQSSPERPKPSAWSRRFGDAAPQESVRMARDNQGNVFLTGGFSGSVDLGAGPLTSAGDEDLLVARLEPDGTVRWSQRFGDTEAQRARSLAVVPTGGLLVFGDFQGTLDFGAQHHVSTGGARLFLVQFDTDGTPLWSRDWGEGDLMDAAAVEVAADGTITLLGSFTGSVDFGCGKHTSAGVIDVFLARLSAEGQCLWSRHFGDANLQGAEALAVDAEGNIAIWGYFLGTLDFGGKSLVNGGPLWDSYLAVFDAQGHPSWSTRLHIAGSEGAPPFQVSVEQGEYTSPIWTIRYTSEGELVFLGDMALPVRAGTEPGAASPPPAIHLARFARNGELLWSQRLGDSLSMDSGQIAVTAPGGLLIAGSVRGTVDLGDGPFAGSGGKGSDLFLLELGRRGEFLWARRFRGTSALNVASVDTDLSGDPILAGVFDGSLDLGLGLLSTAGNSDLFLAQLAISARERPPPRELPCIQPPPGLSAWYPLDEPDVTVGVGETEAGKLMSGARLVAGRERGVLDLEAGFFLAPAQEGLDVGTGDFSLSLWMRTSDSRDVDVLLDKRSQVPPSIGPATGYSLFIDRGQLMFQLADGKGSGNCGPSGSCTNYLSGRFVADGSWHLVTVTVERQRPQGGTFYLDGVAVGRFSPGARSGSLDNTGSLSLGSRSFEGSGRFKGLIDDVALWKRSLSADEVERLHGAGNAGMCRPQSSESPRKP
ncbi:protein kinase domain-containing protein [Hyalangium versicolor]|uniref:protein kinase domain-containing protein n=1 Tax=Hyalangium versicolor TaxID=2861190 RepID=UPI001CCCCE03|nr:protein kinase [Hyalangium versicolor]